MNFEMYCHDKNMIPHLYKVINGEYNLKINLNNPTILDIGANVGSFMIWSIISKCNDWIDPTIHCYEPMTENFNSLLINLNRLKLYNNDIDISKVHLHNVAVGDPKNDKLLLGINNCGENSFYNNTTKDDRTYQIVHTIDGSELPEADILKMDTEGSEVDILERMKIKPIIILLEWHGEKRRRRVDELLQDYSLVKSEVQYVGKHGCGINKYVRNDYLENNRIQKI
jgi:FkbM family methyltransferase